MTLSTRIRKRAASRVGIPAPKQLLRKHFLSGVLVVVPLAVIIWILRSALGVLWDMQKTLPEILQPSAWLDDPSAIAVVRFFLMGVQVVLLGLGISLLGWISKQIFGRKLLEALARLISRIPVLRSIYSALDQLLRTFAANSGTQQFNRVVYIEYPRPGSWALAFVTGPAQLPSHLKELGKPGPYMNLYVPTTPNPTSGFHLILPDAELKESGLTVEEAFRTILSLGIVQKGSSTPNPSIGDD